jgi:hypothetical protein
MCRTTSEAEMTSTPSKVMLFVPLDGPAVDVGEETIRVRRFVRPTRAVDDPISRSRDAR